MIAYGDRGYIKEELNMLNIESPIPLYHQLASIILEKIRSNEYKIGIRIPSEHKLAREFNIGRPTVRQATDLLIRKKILVRKRGSGTYVKEQEEIDLFSLAGTSSAFIKKGINADISILKNISIINIDFDNDNPFFNKNAYFYSRISRVENEPIIIEEIYIDPDIFKGLEKINLADASLSHIIEEQYFMKPTGGKQTFNITYPDKEKANLLKTDEATPILLVKRFLNFKQKDNLIYSRIYCRTDKFVFSQVLGGIINE